MLRKHKNPVIYMVVSLVFFFIAIINYWILLTKDITLYRTIPPLAFTVAGIILLYYYLHSRKPNNESTK